METKVLTLAESESHQRAVRAVLRDWGYDESWIRRVLSEQRREHELNDDFENDPQT